MCCSCVLISSRYLCHRRIVRKLDKVTLTLTHIHLKAAYISTYNHDTNVTTRLRLQQEGREHVLVAEKSNLFIERNISQTL